MCKKIKWGDFDDTKMELWEKGQTGFPYIDAMMRQLDATGWMHHLGRHAVSCFLTRGQLWQHWQQGRDVFDKKLSLILMYSILLFITSWFIKIP